MAESNKIKINDLQIEYMVSYRDVKYPRLELKTGKLQIIVPKGYRNIDELIKRHRKWIYRKSKEILEALEAAKDKKLYSRSRDELSELINRLVKEYSKKLNVKYGRIRIRKMKTKWGSCSNKGNLTFNEMLKYLPETHIKYIVIHELMHLKYKKHNKIFWKMISKKYPKYEKIEKELLSYWFVVSQGNFPKNGEEQEYD